MANNVSLPPNNIEAEKSLLGSMLIDTECIHRVCAIVDANDLYLVRHQWLFAAIVAEGASADMLTVADRLGEKRLEEIGGEGYISEIMCEVPTALNAEAYARIVSDMAVRRRALVACSKVATLAHDTTSSIDELLSATHNEFANTYKTTDRTGATLLERLDEFNEWLSDDSEVDIIPTGIGSFDKIAGGGFARGEYVIIAAPPGVGKTAIAVQMMYIAAMAGRNCAYFSFEVSWRDIVCRMTSLRLSELGHSLPYGKLIKRDMTAEQRGWAIDAWYSICDKIGKRIKIHDPASMTPDMIKSAAISYGAKHPLDIVIVDQMHHMSDGRKGSDDRQRLSAISRGLAQLPKQLREATGRTPIVIALSRLSRSGYEQPEISSLKESGDIESDANLILLAYRDPDDKPEQGRMPNPEGKLFLKIGKNRNGLTNLIVPCKFRGDINRIT